MAGQTCSPHQAPCTHFNSCYLSLPTDGSISQTSGLPGTGSPVNMRQVGVGALYWDAGMEQHVLLTPLLTAQSLHMGATEMSGPQLAFIQLMPFLLLQHLQPPPSSPSSSATASPPMCPSRAVIGLSSYCVLGCSRYWLHSREQGTTVSATHHRAGTPAWRTHK